MVPTAGQTLVQPHLRKKLRLFNHVLNINNIQYILRAKKKRLTCNVTEPFNKRWHHRYRWLQSEQETGRQHLIWHLAQWNEHKTTAPGRKSTVSILFYGSNLPLCKMRMLLLGERFKNDQTPTHEGPAQAAVGGQTPSEVCESRRWRQL